MHHHCPKKSERPGKRRTAAEQPATSVLSSRTSRARLMGVTRSSRRETEAGLASQVAFCRIDGWWNKKSVLMVGIDPVLIDEDS